jgi:hypothetical protein
MLSAKRSKLEKIRPLLRTDLPFTETPGCFNFLDAALAEKHGVVETENVSQHSYDPYALRIINQFPEGLILDCGAGKRAEYLTNVVNFEIVPYDTTDVVGVAEELRLPTLPSTASSASTCSSTSKIRFKPPRKSPAC